VLFSWHGQRGLAIFIDAKCVILQWTSKLLIVDEGILSICYMYVRASIAGTWN
jgi:hypothetical protein